jgi:hypothetical protein
VTAGDTGVGQPEVRVLSTAHDVPALLQGVRPVRAVVELKARGERAAGRRRLAVALLLAVLVVTALLLAVLVIPALLGLAVTLVVSGLGVALLLAVLVVTALLRLAVALVVATLLGLTVTLVVTTLLLA